MSQEARIFVSLGANLGEPARQMVEAVRCLKHLRELRILKISSMYLTEPVGPVAQPPFVNAAAELWSELSPEEILEALLGVETAMGRQRVERWGPRHIDLDLLLYSDRIIEAPGLRVPHPRMHERRFVLAPLAELAPWVIHPRLGRTAAALLDALPSGGAWVKRVNVGWEESLAALQKLFPSWPTSSRPVLYSPPDV